MTIINVIIHATAVALLYQGSTTAPYDGPSAVAVTAAGPLTST